jgi:tetratricopeptide (TPR) repeat protein
MPTKRNSVASTVSQPVVRTEIIVPLWQCIIVAAVFFIGGWLVGYRGFTVKGAGQFDASAQVPSMDQNLGGGGPEELPPFDTAAFRQQLASAKDFDTLVRLGNAAYDATGVNKKSFDPERARLGIQAYEAALKIRPDSPDVLNDCANLHMGMGEFAEAEKHLRAAMAIDPQHTSAYSLGVLYLHAGQKEKAIGALKDFLAKIPAEDSRRDQAQRLLDNLQGQ